MAADRSPDGRLIAALQGTTLKRVDLASGATVDLCQVAVFAGGDWGPAGVILFASRPTGLVHRVPAAGGRCEPATTLDAGRGDTAHRWPSFLPDARRFLYTVEGKEPGLYVGSIDAPMRNASSSEAKRASTCRRDTSCSCATPR